MKKPFAWSMTVVTSLALSVSVVLPTHAAPAAEQPSPAAVLLGPDSAAHPQQVAQLDAIIKKLPADWQSRRDAALAKVRVEESPVREALDTKLAGVINPGDYICSPTKLNAYVDGVVAELQPFTLLILALTGVLDFPTYDALLYGTPKGADYQLPQEFKAPLTTSFGYAQRFWDVKLNDVQLMAMHGTMLTDPARMAKVVSFVYGVEGQEAADLAASLISIVQSDPALKGGDNPLFTLNAFAFSGEMESDPVLQKLKDKMIFGDGILDALKALGLEKVGPRAVLGHEMAHHVQFEDGLFDSPLTGPEATRRTELMADAFGTYFVTHKKGLGFNATQVLQAQETFFDVGDCGFDNPGHHGTPNQRRAASAWGAAVVATAQNPNKVLPSLKLDAKFEKVLPLLVKPDAPTTVDALKAIAK